MSGENKEVKKKEFIKIMKMCVLLRETKCFFAPHILLLANEKRDRPTIEKGRKKREEKNYLN